jgi:hypothetical protein
MAKGAVITIHLADPQQLLKPAANATPVDCQIHLVTAKGMRYLAAIVAATATGRDHAVTVPFGTPFQPQVSPHLAVNDARGAAAIAPSTVMTTASAAGIATVNYTVTGCGREETHPNRFSRGSVQRRFVGAGDSVL